MKCIRILAAVPAIIILTVLNVILSLCLKIAGAAGGLIWLALTAFGVLTIITAQWNQLIAVCVIALAVYLILFAGSFLSVLCEELRSGLTKSIRN